MAIKVIYSWQDVHFKIILYIIHSFFLSTNHLSSTVYGPDPVAKLNNTEIKDVVLAIKLLTVQQGRWTQKKIIAVQCSERVHRPSP